MSIRCAKMLVIVSVLFLLTTQAQSQVMGLWGDEEMGAHWTITDGPYQPFNVYVFLEPGPDGAFAVEYKLNILPGHFSTAQAVSPVVSGATIGVWFGSPGISAPFTSCQNDLFWIVNLTMMAPDTNPGYYKLEENEDSGFMGVAICPDPRPLVDATLYNWFGFNEGWYATEESSWGAIKDLYR